MHINLLKNTQGLAKRSFIIILSLSIISSVPTAVLLYYVFRLPWILPVHFSSLQSISFEGGSYGPDAVLGLYFNETNGILFTTGFITELSGGQNIWLAYYNTIVTA